MFCRNTINLVSYQQVRKIDGPKISLPYDCAVLTFINMCNTITPAKQATSHHDLPSKTQFMDIYNPCTTLVLIYFPLFLSHILDSADHYHYPLMLSRRRELSA